MVPAAGTAGVDNGRMSGADHYLAPFPRVPLGHWPTPLERAPRLAGALGLDAVFLKRDDINGFAGGGNKLRKLEFLLGAALEDGVDTVITSGALQTNHGRQTAAACARLGLRCELVLTTTVPRTQTEYVTSGNVLLDRLFGARLHVCADAAERDRTAEALAEEAAAQGRRAVVLPVGGSNALGSLGYVAAATELFAQLRALDVTSAHIMAPLGSGGTAAGLTLGAELCDWPGTLEFPSVLKPTAGAREELVSLTGKAGRLLGLGRSVAARALERAAVHDRTLGGGYGQPTPQMWRALRLFATEEGVALDPVYTGKAAAALLSGPPPAGTPLVFVHTGGLPGLFAYAGDLDEDLAVPQEPVR